MVPRGILIRKNNDSSFYEVWGLHHAGPHLFSLHKVVEMGVRLREEGIKVWAPKEVLKAIEGREENNEKSNSQVR